MLDAILLYIGGYLLYWGRIWYLYPFARGQMFVGVPMMFYGALAVVAGIIVAWKIQSFLWPPTKMSKARKLIIVVGAAVFDAILLYFGCYLLYWEAISYLYGSRVRIIVTAPLVYGSFAVVVGIFVAWKIKCFLWPSKKAPQESPPLEGSTVRKESTQKGKARYCWKRQKENTM